MDDGPGLGQMRTVTSYTITGDSVTLTVNEPWTITPRHHSNLYVGTTTYNSVFYDNTLQCQTGADGENLNSSAGLELWTGGYNLVFDGNTTDNLQSGTLLASSDTTNPCFFIQVTNNQYNSSLAEGVVFQPSLGDSDPNFVGDIVQGNLVDGVGTQGISLSRDGGALDVSLSETAEPVSLAVVEHNTVENAPVGMLAGLDSESLIYDNIIDTASASAVEYVTQIVNGQSTPGDVLFLDNDID